MSRARYAIEVQDLGKVYKRWDGPWARALEAVTRGRRVGHREVRALEGVSFQLPRGGSLGLVGPNGAGKSTLLKLLSETATPSAGRFRTSGRVASLLELGTGFHPGFSARENAFQNAVLLGVRGGRARAPGAGGAPGGPARGRGSRRPSSSQSSQTSQTSPSGPSPRGWR